MKKLLSMLLPLLLIFAACSSGGANSSEPISSDNPASDAGESSVIAEESSRTEPESSDPAPSEDEPVIADQSDASLDTTDTSLRYVAFGDSIAFGYGLSDIQTQRYPDLVVKKLKETPNRLLSYTNYAVNGDRSQDMLAVLDNAPELAGADLVSISIGANNLLGPTITAFSSVLSQSGYAIISQLQAYLGGSTDTTVQAAVAKFFQYMQSAFDSDEFKTAIANGLEQFQNDLPLLISKIKAAAPDAIIIFQTVYNPLKGVEIKDGDTVIFSLSDMAGGFIGQLNAMITDSAESLGYTVCDVFTVFNQSDDKLLNFNIGSENFSYDPHPNAAGHIAIADSYIKTISDISDLIS